VWQKPLLSLGPVHPRARSYPPVSHCRWSGYKTWGCCFRFERSWKNGESKFFYKAVVASSRVITVSAAQSNSQQLSYFRRVWQKPLLSLGPVHPIARTIVWNGGCALSDLGKPGKSNSFLLMWLRQVESLLCQLRKAILSNSQKFSSSVYIPRPSPLQAK
jgi:hypothetical protein